MKKKIFEAPELEVIMFETCNVILTSGAGENYSVEEKKEQDLDQFDIKFN